MFRRYCWFRHFRRHGRFEPWKLVYSPKEGSGLASDGSNLGADTKEINVPTSPFFVLYGMINGRQCKVLKNDGWNTNILSRDFVKKNRKILKLTNQDTEIEHYIGELK